MNLESAWWHAYNQQSKNEAICWRMSHLPRQACISEQQPPLPPLIMNTPQAVADGRNSSFSLLALSYMGVLCSKPHQVFFFMGKRGTPQNSKLSPGEKGNPGLPVLLTDGSAPQICNKYWEAAYPSVATHNVPKNKVTEWPQTLGRSMSRVSGVSGVEIKLKIFAQCTRLQV